MYVRALCIIYYLHQQQMHSIFTIYKTLSLRSSLNVSDQVKEDTIRNKKNRANYKYE